MNKILPTFLVIAISFFSFASIAAPSDLATELKVCENYLALNKQLGCTSDNYLMTYGYNYCVKYAQYDSLLLPETQEVLQKIRRCLVNDLETQQSNLTCSSVEDFAFNSHVGCYVNSGYCSIDKIDKGIILAVAHNEIQTENFIKTAAAVLLECEARK